ncbi:DUF4129 domain-containing protein [Halogranum gelatinilyticum]|uniref:DUF4129 domain-containing protein n=1 Tax=Halogranum gelatinilyticum TaxID=660521 RepID=UPI0011140AFB|nr:DUF4129 domain-containing protein [Halogranum gelatinilyticum]
MRVLGLVAILLCSVVVVPAGATGQTSSSQEVDVRESVDSDATVPFFQQQNNTTVRHEDPDSTNENGDLDGVESHLAGVLAERLGESTVQLSQGEYDRARDLVGDDYSSPLEKYVDVAGETGNEATAEEFEDAQEAQQELTNTVQEFRETREEYREAKQNGNERRARELARELSRLSQQSEQNSQRLTQSFANVSNQTGIDVSDSTQTVDDIQRNVSAQEQDVIAAEFTQTDLTIDVSRSEISFQSPLLVSGRLVAENGSTLTQRRISLEAGSQTITTTTDSEGRFSFNYRPVTLPLSTESVTIRYIPNNTSVYLGSNATATVSVTQTNASLAITSASSSVAYREEMTVTGVVSVNGTSVEGMPVLVSLGNTPLETVQTNTDGRFQLETALPATVSAGTQQLSVKVERDDRAVTASPARQAVEVEQTVTTLSVTAEEDSTRSVRLSGEFKTADGSTISNQQIKFLVNGSLLGTSTTGPEGGYQSRIQIPESVVSGVSEEVTVRAVFTGGGTNLESARATVSVPITSDNGSGEEDSSLFAALGSLPTLISGAVVLTLVVASGVAYSRRSEDDETATVPTTGGPASQPTEPTETAGRSLLTLARDHVDRGKTETAIEAAYEALRRRFEGRLELAPSATHWEFYQQYHTEIGDQSTELRELTERYEQAAYGPHDPSASDASAAIALSERFFNPNGQPSDDD